MKLNLILPMFLAFLFFTACSDNDTITTEYAILGTWKLTNARAYDGLNLDYPEGEATWRFNANGTLDVVNNIMTLGPESMYSQFDTGTYNYQITTTGGTTTIIMDYQTPDTVTFGNNNLVLSSTVANGSVRTFRR